MLYYTFLYSGEGADRPLSHLHVCVEGCVRRGVGVGVGVGVGMGVGMGMGMGVGAWAWVWGHGRGRGRACACRLPIHCLPKADPKKGIKQRSPQTYFM